MTSPGNRTLSLATFSLDDLAGFTREGRFDTDASPDFRLFYVGRDDVHAVLMYLWSRVTISAYLNMFGYDDDELNTLVMQAVADPQVTTLVTLDKSQSGGKHERAILDSDVAADPVSFAAHVTIGTSATHQISHTKGGVLDGKVGFEGSTNWSVSGEGQFVSGKLTAGGPGYKAQNNTLTVFVDRDACARFTAELVAEHMAAAPVTGGAGGHTA